ncbi:hypothetical protein RYH80_18645 [Halobaculum sp. MBLA0147]|uniref:hypothetical protein n=1 Tax=Halobaculum sp. MBLA0147 TaxID=3079934 RepID=UPI003524DD1F
MTTSRKPLLSPKEDERAIDDDQEQLTNGAIYQTPSEIDPTAQGVSGLSLAKLIRRRLIYSAGGGALLGAVLSILEAIRILPTTAVTGVLLVFGAVVFALRYRRLQDRSVIELHWTATDSDRLVSQPQLGLFAVGGVGLANLLPLVTVRAHPWTWAVMELVAPSQNVGTPFLTQGTLGMPSVTAALNFGGALLTLLAVPAGVLTIHYPAMQVWQQYSPVDPVGGPTPLRVIRYPWITEGFLASGAAAVAVVASYVIAPVWTGIQPSPRIARSLVGMTGPLTTGAIVSVLSTLLVAVVLTAARTVES